MRLFCFRLSCCHSSFFFMESRNTDQLNIPESCSQISLVDEFTNIVLPYYHIPLSFSFLIWCESTLVLYSLPWQYKSTTRKDSWLLKLKCYVFGEGILWEHIFDRKNLPMITTSLSDPHNVILLDDLIFQPKIAISSLPFPIIEIFLGILFNVFLIKHEVIVRVICNLFTHQIRFLF